jgi:hypothetical protein
LGSVLGTSGTLRGVDPNQTADMASAFAMYMPVIQGTVDAAASGTVKAAKGAMEDWVKRGWQRLLQGASETDDRERSALELCGRELAAEPDDADSLAMLRRRIRNLSSYPEIDSMLADWWQEGVERGLAPTASKRSVAIGGNVKGSAIVTGDTNETTVVQVDE